MCQNTPENMISICLQKGIKSDNLGGKQVSGHRYVKISDLRFTDDYVHKDD